jgi:hypothetical protein
VVRFLPPQVETNQQGMMTVALIIENATEVSSAPLQVAFDSKVVKLNDVGRGDFFSSDGQVPVFTKNIQNDAGNAVINLRLPGSPGMTCSGCWPLSSGPSPRHVHRLCPTLPSATPRAGCLLRQPADDHQR